MTRCPDCKMTFPTALTLEDHQRGKHFQQVTRGKLYHPRRKPDGLAPLSRPSREAVRRADRHDERERERRTR